MAKVHAIKPGQQLSAAAVYANAQKDVADAKHVIIVIRRNTDNTSYSVWYTDQTAEELGGAVMVLQKLVMENHLSNTE